MKPCRRRFRRRRTYRRIPRDAALTEISSSTDIPTDPHNVVSTEFSSSTDVQGIGLGSAQVRVRVGLGSRRASVPPARPVRPPRPARPTRPPPPPPAPAEFSSSTGIPTDSPVRGVLVVDGPPRDPVTARRKRSRRRRPSQRPPAAMLTEVSSSTESPRDPHDVAPAELSSSAGMDREKSISKTRWAKSKTEGISKTDLRFQNWP